MDNLGEYLREYRCDSCFEPLKLEQLHPEMSRTEDSYRAICYCPDCRQWKELKIKLNGYRVDEVPSRL